MKPKRETGLIPRKSAGNVPNPSNASIKRENTPQTLIPSSFRCWSKREVHATSDLDLCVPVVHRREFQNPSESHGKLFPKLFINAFDDFLAFPGDSRGHRPVSRFGFTLSRKLSAPLDIG